VRSKETETHKLSARYAAVSILVLASAMWPSSTVAQTLLNASDLIKSSDYPAGSMSRGEEGIAAYELSFKDGRPAKCSITSSSGFEELDSATCRLVMERSLFDMTTLTKGKWPYYYNRVRWSIRAWDQPRAVYGNITATQSVSRIDPNKIRCQYSDGEVGFVSAGSPCIQAAGVPNQQSVVRVTGRWDQADQTLIPTLPIAREKADFNEVLKAARAGDKSKFLTVAEMYMTGAGVEQDDTKALFWTQRAEKAGLTEAKYTLALMHAQGGAVEQDLQKSYDYLNAYVKAGSSSIKADVLFESIRQSAGESVFSCMTYGFRQGTPSFAQCQMQADQAARLAQQQAQLAQQQAQFAQQQAQFAQQQYQLQAQQYERQLAADRLAREREERAERQAAADELIQMGADMLCPKVGGRPFGEPVAGCGRNKNVPQAPTVNVYVAPEKKYCGATAAGPIKCD
jgi:hypothetical protein